MDIENYPNHKRFWNIIFLAIFCFAFFIRIYKLEEYPGSVNQDELSNIYDAYSISETGADRWGTKHPLILRGFGNPDYRPPLFAWVAAPSVKIFGFSVFAGRFTSAILATLALLLLFFVARKIGGQIFAILALLLASLSPLNILFSRMALEATSLTVLFVTLALWLWIKVRETNYKTWYLMALGLTIGLATSAYQPCKLTSLLWSIIIGIELMLKSQTRFRSISIFAAGVFIGSFPQIFIAYTEPEHFFSRANGSMMPFEFSWNYFKNVLANIWSNLSPEYLFLSFGKSNNLSVARLLMVELPFFYLGLLLMFRVLKNNKSLPPFLLYLLLFVFILPGSLTQDNPHALRTYGASILFPLFSASAIVFLYQKIKKDVLRFSYLILVTLMIVINSVVLINHYSQNSSLKDEGQQNSIVQMSKRINSLKEKYSNIYIEDVGNQPYIYIASYCGFKPAQFQAAYKNYEAWGWDHFIQLDKYWFLNKTALDTISPKPGRKELFVMLDNIPARKMIDSLDTRQCRFYFYEQ